MIAMGGCIGTGLFMTSGGAIHDAGALGALIAYAIMELWYSFNDFFRRNGYVFTCFGFI